MHRDLRKVLCQNLPGRRRFKSELSIFSAIFFLLGNSGVLFIVELYLHVSLHHVNFLIDISLQLSHRSICTVQYVLLFWLQLAHHLYDSKIFKNIQKYTIQKYSKIFFKKQKSPGRTSILNNSFGFDHLLIWSLRQK